MTAKRSTADQSYALSMLPALARPVPDPTGSRDGRPGKEASEAETWPEVSRQRCVGHLIWNALANVPKK